MKAKIYGHDIEGTPEEIAKFKELIDEQIAKLSKTTQYTYFYYNPVYTGTSASPLKWNEITCSGTIL